MPGDVRRHGALILALVALLGVGACTGDDGGDPDPSTSPSASAPATTAPLPDGWTRETQGYLSFGLPEGFRQSGGSTGDEGSQTTYRADDGSETPARIDVFTEEGQVGPLDVRVPLLVSRLEAELGTTIGEPDDVEVAGAPAAQEFAYRYRLPQDQGGDEIRQVDLLVDTEEGPKYGIRYAAPADTYDDQVWTDLKATLLVGTKPSTTG